MAHGKETPRQKMIGMMYLVLMALLALNVSNEVLNAFAVLDSGLTNTKETIEQANTKLIDEFKFQNDLNSAKVGTWYSAAKEVHKQADSIVNFIQTSKMDILKLSGDLEAIEGKKIDLTKVEGRDKTSEPANIMIGENNDRAGKELKNMMDKFRSYLLTQVLGEKASEVIKKSVEASLSTEPDKRLNVKGEANTPWEAQHFEHLPLSGVLSIMSGLQINVRNAESEVLKYLYTGITKADFKFSEIDATVIPNSNYIIKGTPYTAQIFLAASDPTAKPRIYIAESRTPYDSTRLENGEYSYSKKEGLNYTTISADTSTGKATYIMPSGSMGPRFWGGIIELDAPDGSKISKPFKRSYLVAEGSVSVAPTKMNVFYLGVDNPIEVSVAGVQPENVSIDITNASNSKKGPSSYIVKPKRAGNAIVNVYANIDGKRRLMAQKEFRVKIVPNPVPKVNGISGGGIIKNILLAQVGVAAEMENFDFDLEFRVTEFTVSTTVQGFIKEETAKNYKFTPAQKNLLQGLNKGQRVYIQDIEAVGPDGSIRKLPSIALLVN